jgi:hypothetical protein
MGNNCLSSTPKFEIPVVTCSISIYKVVFHGKTTKKRKEKVAISMRVYRGRTFGL